MSYVVSHKYSIRNILALAAITLCMLILPFAFIDEKIARILFYLCGYFSIAGLIYEVCLKKTKIAINPIALSFLALGLMYITWSIISGIYDQQEEKLLITAGKRLLLAYFIMSYITLLFYKEIYPRALLAKLALASVIIGFIIATSYGIVQGAIEPDRIVLGINRATLTAYAYSALSLALATSLLQMKHVKLRSLLFVIIALLSIYVVCLTETRSTMVIHTLLIAVLALRFFHFSRNPLALILIFLAITIGLGANLNIIENRVDSTLSEYQRYQHNDDKTSLGSRFSMWKVGGLAFEHAPLGQTLQERNEWIKTWLISHNMQDSDVLLYLDVHLHNEFIQYASTFGIAGILLLAFFYLSAIVKSIKLWGVINPVAVATIALMLYGMTDVLLSSIEMIVIISVLFTLMTVITEYNSVSKPVALKTKEQ